MTTDRKVHLLNLHEGDLYRYSPGGPVFRVTLERDDKGKTVRMLAQHADGTKSQIWAVVEYEGCFVYPVDQPEEGADADQIP